MAGARGSGCGLPVTPLAILAGKVLPSVLVATAQIGLLLVLGRPLFGLEATGS